MDERLHTLAWTFNVQPSTYCDREWLPAGLRGPAADATLVRPSAHRYLSPWLLAELGIATEFHFDFSRPISRLALLPAAALRRALTLLGLVLHRDVLRRMVSRAELDQVAALTGSDEVKLARASVDDLPLMLRTEDTWPAQGAALRATLERRGLALFWALLPVAPAALTRRAALKLPRATSADLEKMEVFARSDRQGIGDWLLTRALPGMEPKWAWLLS